MIKPAIIHTSDNHLRERQYNSPARGMDFYLSLMGVVELAKKMGAKFIANTGDLLNSSRPSSGTIAQLRAVNQKLIEYGITMGTISGNHDMADPPWHSLVEPGTVGGIINMDNRRHSLIVDDGTRDGRLVEILGLPFCTKEELLKTLQGLQVPVDIVMWHGAVREFIGFPSETAVTIEELEACGKVGSFLLGDIHVHQYYSFRARPGFVGYSGSTEMCEKGEPVEKKVGAIYYDTARACMTVDGVAVPTRKVLHRQLSNEEVLQTVLVELDTMKAFPIILIGNYNPKLNQVLIRVRAALNPDSVMLLSPQNYTTSAGVESAVKVSAITKPSELVPTILRTDNSRLLALACSLADSPDADPDLAMQDYLREVYQL